MEPAKPETELILSPAEVRGRCQICGHVLTDILCHSCNPEHYLCRDCIRGHRDGFNRVPG
jgi:hypothetical protein